MDRYLKTLIQSDSASKIILLMGPRQCGKTTVSKQLFSEYVYLNYDLVQDRADIHQKHWRRDVEAVIFDELHKMSEWKRWIKGIYDTEGLAPRLLVTGSANMDAFTKVGDSLAGRFFSFRLHPFDLKELVRFSKDNPNEMIKRLLTVGGFPEPYLNGSEVFYRRWRKTHLDVILKQDLLDLTQLRSIQSLELLVRLLMNRVGSPVSYVNLASDLQVDGKTVKSWLMVLENVYVLFKVTPYHHNLARAILKEPKYYFFDIPRVEGEGPRLENLVACALFKEVQWIEDSQGLDVQLHYLRTRDGQEVDFLIALDQKPMLAIEVKASDSTVSPHLRFFKGQYPEMRVIQLVYSEIREFDTPDGIQVRRLVQFLSTFSLLDYLPASQYNPATTS